MKKQAANTKTAKIQDLTVGTPIKVLAIYAIPMLISMFFQQAYNLVDSWIAGNFIGEVALGAVGTCYPITVFLIAISSGLSFGTSVVCSQSYGAKAMAEVKTAITSSLYVFLPLAVVISAVGIALSPAVVTLLSVPAEVFDATVLYLRIYLVGFIFQFLYNIVNGALTGLGNSKTPLLYLIISSICNIVLDWLFVVVFRWGVAGLALATILSQALSAGMTSVTILQISRRMLPEGQRFSGAVMGKILRLGIPSMIEHLLMSLGQLSLQSVINGYGMVVMAGCSVAMRINGLVNNSFVALSNALSGFVAQNVGAGEYDRIKSGIRSTLLIACSFGLCVIIVLQNWGAEILGFFVEDADSAQAVISAGMGFVRVVSPFYLVVCLKIIFDGALRGIGAMTAFMLATMSDVAVRMLCGEPFSQIWGIDGVWAVWPTAWFVGMVLSVGLYGYHSKKKKIR